MARMFFRTAERKNEANVVEEDSNSGDEFEAAKSEIGTSEITLIQKPSKPILGINLDIRVCSPTKVGSGFTAHFLFQVYARSRSELTVLKKAETCVHRSFSDFIALHDKLVSKHRPSGFLIPPVPEKNALVTFARMSASEDDDCTSCDHVEKKRAALERFLNRIARHPVLSSDEDFIVFLENDGMLSSFRSSLFFPARLMKLVNGVLNNASLSTTKYVLKEKDSWFTRTRDLVEKLENHLSALHGAYGTHVSTHRDVATDVNELAGSLTIAGGAEEDESFVRVMSFIADALTKIGSLHHAQADMNYFCVSELLADHVKIWNKIKDMFQDRLKLCITWVESCKDVEKINSSVVRMDVYDREQHASLCRNVVKNVESEEGINKLNFQLFSRCAKIEIERFEDEYCAEFKHIVLMFFYQMIKSLEQIINVWEEFLPETAV